MSPLLITVWKIRRRHLAVLVVLVFMSFFLARLVEDYNAGRALTAMAGSVSGRVVAVDPGHGGGDSGVTGKTGVPEKDINLAVALRLADYLGQAGARVVLTRETDTGLSDPGTVGLAARKKEDLQRRVDLANQSEADLFISIHVNSSPDPNRSGAQVFIQRGSQEGRKVGRLIQEELDAALPGAGLRPVEVDYVVTRNTLMPAVVVETGYITNEREERLLIDPAYQDRIARAIFAGTVKYFAGPEPDFRSRLEREKVIKTFKEHNPERVYRP